MKSSALEECILIDDNIAPMRLGGNNPVCALLLIYRPDGAGGNNPVCALIICRPDGAGRNNPVCALLIYRPDGAVRGDERFLMCGKRWKCLQFEIISSSLATEVHCWGNGEPQRNFSVLLFSGSLWAVFETDTLLKDELCHPPIKVKSYLWNLHLFPWSLSQTYPRFISVLPACW